jgi:hypothetical protein
MHMHRRNFGLSIAAAALLAQRLRQAAAQGASRLPSAADADSAWRMRDTATALLATLDEPTRKTVSFPLEAEQRTSWSNLPVALVPRVGLSIGTLSVESRRRFYDLLRASTSWATTRWQRLCATTTFCAPRSSSTCSIIRRGRGQGAMPSRVWDRRITGLRYSASRSATAPGPGC